MRQRIPISKSIWPLALVFLVATGPISTLAADSSAPVHNVDGSFVREWLVLGPFPSRDFGPDFLVGAGGEANIRPKEGDTVTRSDGTRLAWTRLRSAYDIVNLEKVFGIQSRSVAYAYCELHSDRTMETYLRPPVSPSLPWINGKKVEPTPVLSGNPGNVPLALPIQLKAGPNRCLLKIGVESSDWTFSLQPLPSESAKVELLATDSAGQPVPDALIQIYDQGEQVWRLRTGPSGRAEACLYPLAKAYDLRVTSGEMGAWLCNIALQPGERRNVNTVLSNVVSISGRVLALDRSPQNAIVVQALRDSDSGRAEPTPSPLPRGELASGPLNEAPLLGGAGGGSSAPPNPQIKPLLPLPPFSETVLSDTNGNFRFVNLRPGAYRLRAHGLDGFIYPTNNSARIPSPTIIVAPGRANEPIQFAFAEAKKGVWRNYPITKGLVELNPASIHRTRDGMLWVGTQGNALHSYDGVEFKMFSAPQIPGANVEAIKQDSSGAVWVGTSSGMSRSVGGQFQPVPFDDGLPRNYTRGALTDPDGSVWCATASGLLKYGGGKWSRWTVADGLPLNTLHSVMRASDGALWMGSGMGLVKFEKDRFSVPVVFSEPNSMNITGLHQAKDGAIWFGAPNLLPGGAYRFDGRTLRRFGAAEGLLSDQVHSVAETSDGDLWFGTLKGLSRFNGTTIVNYTVQDGLSNDWVRHIFVDEDDVLWLANGWGVSRFDPNNFLGLSNRDGLHTGSRSPTGVFAIERDPEDGFWVGTEWGGVYRINRPGRQPAVTQASLQYIYVRQIHCDNKGTLWFGTSSGIYKQVDGALSKVLDRNWVIALTSDDQGHLWFGNGWNGGGASRFDPATGMESVFTMKNGLPDDSVWALAHGPGRSVWIGTGAGLARADGETIENEGSRLGLPAASVFHLRRDVGGTLWISTSRGLYSWDGKKVLSITATNGLPDENVWCSEQTRDGIVWIGTSSGGLVGYDGKATTVLDKRDGLQGNNVFSLAIEGDDALWAGFLDGGLTRYRRSKSRPSVRLLEVKLGDQRVTNLASVPKFEIRRPISVQYQEIDLKTRPEKRQFYYRLANASDQTVIAGVTKDRRFDWTPRKGGAYTFEVQAIDRDLNYSTPARLAFRATVPWYANAWITVPGGGAFGGLVIWAFIARAIYLRQRREAERLREQMLLQERQSRAELEEANRSLAEAKHAAEAANRAKSTFLANMSHEIRTPLNAVLGYAQILQQDRSLGTDQRQSAATIERSGSHLLSLINEVLDLSKIEAGKMELSEKDFDLRELIRSLSEMFELRCRQKGLEWRVEFESKVQSPKSKVRSPKAD